MKPLSLRSRIIIALIALALGTTLVLSLLAKNLLDQSLQVSITPEIGQALNDALVLAKENYSVRKAIMVEAGGALAESPILNKAFQNGDLERLRDVFKQRELSEVSLRFAPRGSLPASLADRLVGGPQVFKSPEQAALLQMAVPVWENGRIVAALFVTERLDKLINVERAAQTVGHLQMIFDHTQEDLYRAFLLTFLVAAAGVVLVTSVVGIRIGFEITGPLYALIKGTRELARDNLHYRIPRGRDDEIGLVIDSFNRMAEDLNQNRRQRVEAEKIAAWQEIARRLAHEIKNPLTPIQLTVQQMRDKYAGDDPAYRNLIEDCTEIVTEEVESLRGLVQEFADFARMPSLSLKRHDLNSVGAGRRPPLSGSQHQARPSGRPARTRLRRGTDAPRADQPDRKRRGGSRRERHPRRLHAVPERDRKSSRSPIPGRVWPERNRERIFQPYVSTKENGMGLGLAMVAKYC